MFILFSVKQNGSNGGILQRQTQWGQVKNSTTSQEQPSTVTNDLCVTLRSAMKKKEEDFKSFKDRY